MRGRGDAYVRRHPSPVRAPFLSVFVALGALCVLGLAGCTTDSTSATPKANPNTIVVGSFDFGESRQLAAIYGEALRRRGLSVRFALDLGPREFVAPAVAKGL